MRTFGLGLQLGMGNTVARAASGGGGLAFSALVQSLNPWGYWRLDETGTLTTHADSSGNGRTATWSGVVGTASGGLIADSTGGVTVAGGVGKASTSAQFLANHATDAISGICLMRTTQSTGTPTIVASNEANSTRAFSFARNATGIEFQKVDSGGLKGSNQGFFGVINDGNTHLIGFCFDPTLASGEITLFCDNLSPDIGSLSDKAVTGTNTSVVTLLGGRTLASPVGEFDEIALWKGKALTEAEFLSLYEATGLGA